MLIRIQHRVGRDGPLERLLADLPASVEVITDDGMPLDPWRGYRLCLSSLPDDQSHVVVLQDDTIVCRNFVPAVERIAAANQETVVSLFLSKVPRRTFSQAMSEWGKSPYAWVHPQDLVHVVGVLWPIERARSFLQWVDANQSRLRGREFASDDATLTRWMRFTRERIRVTIPSLVQHPDDVPSVVNEKRVSHGADSGRTSACWIGSADPLEIDWSKQG